MFAYGGRDDHHPEGKSSPTSLQVQWLVEQQGLSPDETDNTGKTPRDEASERRGQNPTSAV